MKQLLCIIISCLAAFPLMGQTAMLLPIVVIGNDTFPSYQIPDIIVVSKRTFKDPLEQSRFNQLKRNVTIVYPYAKEAGTIFREINSTMSSLDKKRERKKFMKLKEDELDELFEGDLKNLTVTQGEILCKLVARETGMSVYDLITEFKNPVSAFYWNKMSQFLGYSLRYEYNPQQEKDIEFIVRSLEGIY
ncbi:MAG: DUF4294 domain-containing protein [Chitinophagales bacterium]|jgi:hypothetical protein|nr:DUF4294 domain-containing protein [Chitinophagales bacterium]